MVIVVVVQGVDDSVLLVMMEGLLDTCVEDTGGGVTTKGSVARLSSDLLGSVKLNNNKQRNKTKVCQTITRYY